MHLVIDVPIKNNEKYSRVTSELNRNIQYSNQINYFSKCEIMENNIANFLNTNIKNYENSLADNIKILKIIQNNYDLSFNIFQTPNENNFSSVETHFLEELINFNDQQNRTQNLENSAFLNNLLFTLGNKRELAIFPPKLKFEEKSLAYNSLYENYNIENFTKFSEQNPEINLDLKNFQKILDNYSQIFADQKNEVNIKENNNYYKNEFLNYYPDILSKEQNKTNISDSENSNDGKFLGKKTKFVDSPYDQAEYEIDSSNENSKEIKKSLKNHKLVYVHKNTRFFNFINGQDGKNGDNDGVVNSAKDFSSREIYYKKKTKKFGKEESKNKFFLIWKIFKFIFLYTQFNFLINYFIKILFILMFQIHIS